MSSQLCQLSCALVLLFASHAVQSQSHDQLSSGSGHPRTDQSRITGKIDDKILVRLPGNVRPEISSGSATDMGLVSGNVYIQHVMLQLQRSPALQAALDTRLAALQDPKSPYYHHWLTPDEFGQDFGVYEWDLQQIVAWLKSYGLTVNITYPSRMVIDFSGSATQVQEVLHMPIHYVQVNGATHLANTTDPSIPAALAPVIAGVVSLNDFHPHTMHRDISATHIDPRSGALMLSDSVSPDYTYYSRGQTYQAVVPADLATIYNFNPVFNSGVSGQHQTIALIEDSDVYRPQDWSTFRSVFGLSKYTAGSYTETHPAPPWGQDNCSNPGVVAGNESEAILDAEWASAAAPSAAIQSVSCADTNATFGGLIAILNLVNATAPPPAIMSISYGECEEYNGAAGNLAYKSAYEQAVAEGVSVFVAAGDSGAATCDAGGMEATHGITVSGFASTPDNVAVGGTDFADTEQRSTSAYWNSSSSSTYGSAKSYIPEIPWNNSCASTMLSAYITGSSVTYGNNGFCNTPIGADYYLTTAAGAGGPSQCATGAPSISGVASGTCKGYPKPSWQTGVVGLAWWDGVRDMPDVSMFAANGIWGHYYVYCWSDVAVGGAACTGAPSNWSGAGGTSFAAPIMAGVQALVNQKTSSRQGNPNYVYYKLAAAEFGTKGNSSCNSTMGKWVGNWCTFHDIIQGDMDLNCTGTHNCYRPSGTNGILSLSDYANDKAYGTSTGWDFASGLGTVNVNTLVNDWKSVAP